MDNELNEHWLIKMADATSKAAVISQDDEAIMELGKLLADFSERQIKKLDAKVMVEKVRLN
jgi:predicted secreted acid phosphatase